MMRRVLRHGARLAASFAWWTLWLVLALTAALQVHMAVRHEMAVPRPVLVALERRLAASGLRAEFGRARFDPTGRILMEDVRLSFAGFEEPVVVARSVSARLSLLGMIAGHFDPEEVRVSGVSARVPAMLSPSGAADEIVSDVDAEIQLRTGAVRIPFFTGWIGNLAVAGSGTLDLPSGPAAAAGTGPLPMADLLARRYGAWTRRAAVSLALLANLSHPCLRVHLTPAVGGAGWADFVLTADELHLPAPVALTGSRLRVSGQWNLAAEEGAPLRWEVEAERLAWPGRFGARDLCGVIGGVVAPAKPGGWPIAPLQTAFAARAVAVAGASVADGYGHADLSRWPLVTAEGGAWLSDQPAAAALEGDAAARSGVVRFDARLDQALLAAVDARWHTKLRGTMAWTSPILARGECRFAAGGKFAGAWADVAVRDLTAETVRVDEGRARIELAGGRLVAPHAFARVGGNFAHGTFEEDLATGNYRFLLDGRLKPLDITPWIAGSWWPDFFGNFRFPQTPPTASMDLRGNWTDGRKAEIFLRVDAPGIELQGLGFDDLAGRLFVRPQWIDALDFRATRAGGEASGSFARSYNLKADAWSRLQVDLVSTMELPPLAGVLGGDAKTALAGVVFSHPPRLEVAGYFTGPGDPGGIHRDLRIAARSDSALTFHGLPFDNVAFAAQLHDDDVSVESATASIAGGQVDGHARLAGPAADRRLSFAVAAREINLTQAIATAAAISGRPVASGSAKRGGNRFIAAGASVRLNARVSAEGRFGDPYSFHGSGNLDLHGGEIGELHALGLLSVLLRFTALRFTSADADVQIDGHDLVFPAIAVTGANSAITAHGTCDLDQGALDIRARLRPFKESHTIPQKFMDLVLTPLSDVLEVRLVGTVEKPKWVFVNGPTNFLGGLGPPNGVAPVR